jgi:general stress protein YciG
LVVHPEIRKRRIYTFYSKKSERKEMKLKSPESNGTDRSEHYRHIGSIGGRSLKESRGSDYYRSIAQKGGQATVSKYGTEHFSQMGRKGGNATKERQGPDFYSRIGKLGGQATRKRNVRKND